MFKEDVIAVIQAISENDFNEVFYQIDFFPGDNEAARMAIREAAVKAGLNEVMGNGCSTYKREYEDGQYTDGTITVYDK